MGRSGQLLRTELGNAGLRSTYITNVVKCRPPDNREPTPDELKACRPYLDEELAEVQPKYVLSLGKTATKAIFKKAKITQVHGQFFDVQGFRGMPAFHPAYALRDPSKLPAFKKDLERLRRDMDGEEWDSEVEWERLHSGTLRQFVAEFSSVDEFSFDLETSGLFPFRPGLGTITSVNIGITVDGKDKAWIIPMHMLESSRLGDIESQKRLMWFIYRLAKGKKAYAHNGKFDNHWLFNKYGFRFRLAFDTMLAHHTLDENSPHDLEYLARFYLEAGEYDIPLKEKQWPTNLPQFFDYAGKDAVYTLRLTRIFRKLLRAERGLKELFFGLVMPAARAMGEIEQEGLPWNVPEFEKVGAKIAVERDQLQGELNVAVHHHRRNIKGPKKTVNWNSPAQVGKVLFDELGIKAVLKTPKGRPSTSEAALIELKGKHPVVDALLLYREKAKFHSTYIEGFRELLVDDRLYISYKLHGTVTGRYSSRLHSIPRDGEIRNLGIAPDGWEFCQGDLSQAELRIAAELSGDTELRRCFAPGGPDVHWSTLLHTIESGASGEYVQPVIDTARKIEALSGNSRLYKPNLVEAVELLRKAGHEAAIAIWKEWKEGRKRAKAINFGFIYGMYENKFIETCKLKYGFTPTFEEAAAFRRAYFELYRGIPIWHDRTKGLLAIDGFVRSLSGRIRRLPGVHSSDKSLRMEAERQAINSPVQGFIGDYKAMCMVEIHNEVDHNWFRLVGEHHDALLGMVRKAKSYNESKERAAVLRQIKSIMRHPKILDKLGIKMSIPMEAELEIGPWGAGKTWREE